MDSRHSEVNLFFFTALLRISSPPFCDSSFSELRPMDSRHSEFTHRLTADFQYAHCDFHNYFADIHAYRD
jgi:hypothetical protein